MPLLQKKKILLICSEFPPGPGGIGNHAYHLAKYFHGKTDIDLSVLCDTYFTNQIEVEKFDKSLSFFIKRIFRHRFIFITYIKRFLAAYTLVRKNDYVICSGKFPLWQGGLWSSFFSKKQFIAIAHGSELDLKSEFFKSLTLSSLQKFDKVISVSSYTASFLPEKPKNQKRAIIPNGIALKDFFSEDEIVETKKPRLLTVGNVTQRKGQHNVIGALPEILKTYPKAQYDIVGLPTNKDELLQLAKTLGVEGAVHFHGAVNQADLIRHYNDSDIFIMLSEHTSSGDFEGFGISILEANACGKPAVGSENSGIVDAIADNETGVLVNPHDPKAITAAVGHVLNNYEKMSKEAVLWAGKHDWSEIGKLYEGFVFG